MANAHELARGHKRLRALIEFAVGEGWHVKRTPGGPLARRGGSAHGRSIRPGGRSRSWGLRGVRPWLT